MLRLLISSWAAANLCAAAMAASLLDTSFDPGSGASGGIVEQVLPLEDGHILICGNFTGFNGTDRAFIARLNSNGDVDQTFRAGPGYWVRNMSVQPDGKIIIGGYFTTVDGISRNLVARLDSDGSLDESFNPGAGAEVIIAGGIDGNKTPFVFWTAVQPDGKILITGNFRNYNGDSSTGIARINPDGSRDTTFNVGSGLDSWGRHIRIQPNGQILLSGWFTSYNNRGFNRLVRINSDGSADTTFNPFFGDKTAIYCTALPGDGKVIATGHSLNEENLFKREMVRLNADGTVDETFGAFTNEKTETAVIQPDGRLIVGGNFNAANDVTRKCVARFNPDGSLDNNFAIEIDNFVWSCALQPDGKLLIAGGFTSIDGVSRVGVARLETSGSGGPSTLPPDTAPVLRVSATTTNSLTLSWTDTSVIRTRYDIEQQTGGADKTFSKVAQASSSTRSYTITPMPPGNCSIFRLKAYNSIGSSLTSNGSK